MKVVFAISGVLERLSWVESLKRQLPDARVYIDEPQSGSSWNNYRRALLHAAKSGADWLVKIDDDSLPCRNVAGEVPRALAMCPGDFCEFWFGPGTLDRVNADGASWLATTSVVYGLGWAIRPRLAQEAAGFGDRLVNERSGDRLLAWLRATGRSNFITIPNLIDHRADADSLLFKRPNAGQQSPLFASDPASVVWTREIARPA